MIKNRGHKAAHHQCRRYLCPSDSGTILISFFFDPLHIDSPAV